MGSLVRVLRYFKPYKSRVALTLIFAIAWTITGMFPPFLVRELIDTAVENSSVAMLATYILWIAFAYLLRDVFNMLRIRSNNSLEQQVILDMRDDVFAKMQQFSLGFFSNRSTGELMSRVVDDVNHVERVLLDGTEQVIVAGLTLIGVAGLMFYINPLMAVVALIPIPFLVMGALWYTRRMRNLYRSAREKAADMNATLHDSLSGILQTKIFGREKEQRQSFYARANAYKDAQLDVMYTWSIFGPSMEFIGALGSLFVFFVGGYFVIQGRASIGDVFAFILYLNLFYAPISRLHGLNNLWQDALASSERVFEVMDTPVEIEDPQEPVKFPDHVRGEVAFHNVSFSYQEGIPILKDIDFQVKAGETMAFVGPTGAGKTTIVNLIPRFFDVTQGKVTVDGIDVRDVTQSDLRSYISVVSQEPFLFNGTIRDNLLVGKKDATDDELWHACQLANIDHFIANHRDGLDLIVGERGVKLSVGQKQRISIARAILKNAPILILDEATSSVDTATEMEIQQALDRLIEGKTTFIIAHRLSTIRHANRIACVEDGRITQMGSHRQLVEDGGLYADLWAHQASGVASVENENQKARLLQTTEKIS